MADKPKAAPAYQIGQIVYVLSNSGQAIVPAQIVEQTVVRRLEGGQVSWKLAIGAKNNPDKPQQIVDSEDINGEVYASLEDVKDVLTKKLLRFITDITSQAKKRTEMWYGVKRAKSKPKADNGVSTKVNPEDLLEDLDGSAPTIQQSAVAHMASPAQDQTNLSEEAQKADAGARLREMAAMTDEEMAAEDESEKQTQEEDGSTPMGFIEGPDGQQIPVNLKM